MFRTVTERVAEALYAKFTLPPDEQKLDKNGKRLTINFAKARPCDEPQLEASPTVRGVRFASTRC